MTKVARLVFTLAIILAAAYTATNASAQAAPLPSWTTAVSEFYSGGNLRSQITCDWTNSNGTTGVSGSGDVHLNPAVCASLRALARYGPRDQRGMVLGALGLSVLIHESLHNRVQPGWDSGNEIVITDLGVRLMPDAVARFFGVKPNSSWGRKWRAMTLKTLTV
jgi:hypothetical protein